MKGWGIAGAVAVMAGTAWGQETPLPDYPTCLAVAVGQFESDLTRSRNQASEPNFEIVSRDAIEFCGTLAVVACDRSGDPAGCQTGLAETQVALREAVLAGLPTPEVVRGLDPIWSDGLYPQLWQVAHGSSAGPDCAGADAVYEVWCQTWQASLKLAEAVMLWQVARVLGAAEPAVEAGWVGPPPPPTPMRRPGAEGDQ